MNIIIMVSTLEHKKQTGATFTPEGLSDFLADRILSYTNKDKVKVLDPACGDGALLMAISKKLKANHINYQITGYDSNNDYLSIARVNLLNNGASGIDLIHQDFLSAIEIESEQLSLFDSVQNQNINGIADIVIANPPYVRTQILGSEQAQMLAQKFNLKGRVDLYYPFLIAMTLALKQNGILGVITSNRYLSTKSGTSIRKFLSENFEILEVIDLGDTKLFDAAVLPAIFIGRKKTNATNIAANFLKIYEELNGYDGELIKSDSVFNILNSPIDGFFSDGNKKYKKSSGIVKFGKTKDSQWAMLSIDEAKWVEQIESNSKGKIKDFFKVRIGIKTTADKVFIKDNWENLKDQIPEQALLKDLISQENIKPWASCNEKKLKVLYPYLLVDNCKQVISLDDYPQAKQYFLKHVDTLKGRKYLIDSGREWFEIWVPQNPELWKYPKLVFPDISVMPRFYFDESGKIVNGNCYWIVGTKPDDVDKLLIIQGIANSKLLTKYHDLVFNNKLYSGRRRYFAQYIENYPLPDLNSETAKNIIGVVRELNNSSEKIPETKLVEELENLVAKAYGVSPVLTLD